MGLCAKLNCCAAKRKKPAKDDAGARQNAANGDVKDAAAADSSQPVSNGKETAATPVYAKVNKAESAPSAVAAQPQPPSSPPKRAGFLVSFVVDSRGSAMTGCRGSGIRLIIPPGAVEQPVRVTCRFVRSQGGHQVMG